jgi:hypothetical protein
MAGCKEKHTMKNHHGRTARLFAAVSFATIIYGASPAVAQISLGAAEGFAVLGGSAVTCTDSVVIGDVGVDSGGAVTRTNCTIAGTVHVGDTVAQQAYQDFLLAYPDLADEPCGTVLTVLSGQTLLPGVYCVSAAATETGGVLTLDGSSNDTWMFLIGTSGTGALTGTNFSVVMSSGETCSNNVFWVTAEAATLTDSVFIGSILAGTSVTVTRGTVDGQALAKAAVTLTNTEVSVCGTATNPRGPFDGKVTGGGQIPVPNTTSKGRATFGFNAKGEEDGTATGHFNYLNHMTGLHVNGPVDHVEVIAVNTDGSPKTVQFSGTCGGKGPACSFSVTVQDNGEPGRTDEFGIRVNGAEPEFRAQRVISRGNIQFHK